MRFCNHRLFCKSSELLSEDFQANSMHAIITDPPYGLEVLGNKWDKILPPQKIWEECFKVLRPGGFCLAFAHTTLYHRLACQLEDVGFLIRDCLCWGYATGNPRPYNIDKAIDKREGIETDSEQYPYEPISDAAKLWKGWSNTLKTAWEPIVVAQKPLEGNIVENVLKYQVGGMNIGECRIPYASEKDRKSLESFGGFAERDCGDGRYFSANAGGKKQANVHPDGRWPANLLWLEPLYSEYDHIFMIPKPHKREKRSYNEHDTVKPIRLMEHLIKLVTPRPSVVESDVYVLDPFAGSGTTLVACRRLDRTAIGYENDFDSFVIAEKRLSEKVNKFDIFEV